MVSSWVFKKIAHLAQKPGRNLGCSYLFCPNIKVFMQKAIINSRKGKIYVIKKAGGIFTPGFNFVKLPVR